MMAYSSDISKNTSSNHNLIYEMNHTTIYGKTAVIIYAELNLIYKWNDNLAEENYRPVGVLATLLKIY